MASTSGPPGGSGKRCGVCGTEKTWRWRETRAPGSDVPVPVCDGCSTRIRTGHAKVQSVLPKARKDADPKLVVRLPLFAKPGAAAAAAPAPSGDAAPSGDGGGEGSAPAAPAPAATGIDPAMAEDMLECARVLGRLMQHPKAHWFSTPVAQQWPEQAADYLRVIKRPMDLGTVRAKLDLERYKTPAEFEADVLLVFSNCESYNKEMSDAKRAGRAMRMAFLRSMAKTFKRDTPADQQPEGLRLHSTSLSTQRKRKPNAQFSGFEVFTDDPTMGDPSNAAAWDRIKRARQQQAEGRKSKGQVGHQQRVTAAEKQAINDALQKLSDEEATEVYMKVLRFDKSSGAVGDDPDQEVEVDMDNLSAKTWVKLRAYLGLEPAPNLAVQDRPPPKPAAVSAGAGAGGAKAGAGRALGESSSSSSSDDDDDVGGGQEVQGGWVAAS